MTYYAANATGTINLQATLSAASASSDPAVMPHHPITCQSSLRFQADGAFACEHCEAPAGDIRTQHCLDHSIALLLIEIMREREATP